ncbi:MAG TPA: tetratricopeptide repeat protein [Candidatus Kapabacteria bacterium]|nr:tetratricopeptide repeat protein [Candidatus Kapabacteria bacterium]
MKPTKEAIAARLRLEHLFELATSQPKEAARAINAMRENGIDTVVSDEDAILAYSLGIALRHQDRYNEALRLVSLVAGYSEKKGYTLYGSDCERLIAGIYISMNDSHLGMPCAERSLALAEQDGDPVSIAHSKQQLATLLAMKGEDERSIQLYLEAIGTFERFAPKEVPRALNNYAHHFFKRGDSEAGIKLITEAAEKAEDPGSKAIYLLNIATAQLDLGKTELALDAASQSIALAQEAGRESTLTKAQAIHAHAISLSSPDLLERSMQAVEEADKCFDRLEHLPSKALSLVYRAKHAAMTGECETAMAYLREAQCLELENKLLWDLVFEQTIEEVQKSCANWADAYSALKRFDKLSDTLRAEPSTRMLYANPVGPLREPGMATETESLKAQLDQHAKELLSIREETAQVRSEITSIVHHTRDRLELVRAIQAKIGDIPDRLDYPTFEHGFMQRYPAFVPALKAAHPEITQVHLRICCVTRSGLKAPEAAKLLNLSERTIQNHRYRVKKLFGLAEEESLTSYLKKF